MLSRIDTSARGILDGTWIATTRDGRRCVHRAVDRLQVIDTLFNCRVIDERPFTCL